jgi:uncharacterized OsmC-like protein
MTKTVSITITQQAQYKFLVDFGAAIPALQVDEAAPIGDGDGPAPSQMLLAAVAHCLSSSLYFALQKFKQDGGGLQVTATGRIDRNDEKRLRVLEIAVNLKLGKRGEEIAHLDRVLAQFEPFCTVSQSVQQGIPLVITVEDSQGVRLK